MPITLVTGMPGHGKTLYALELIRTEFKDRKVYIHGIDDVDHEYFGSEDFDPKDWQSLEHGSLLVIDEVHKVWPVRSSHNKPPKYIEDIAEHRHWGFDFVIITQDVWSMDKFVRSRVDRHLHVKRNAGQEFAAIREFQGVHKDPHSDRGKNQALQIKRWRYKKDLFEHYHSATQHTVKKQLPFKFWFMAAGILALIIALVNLAVWAVGFSSDLVEDEPEITFSESQEFEPMNVQQYEPVAASPGTPAWDVLEERVVAEFYSQRIEPLPGLEWTQPLYADVFKPVTFPKPRCVLVKSENRCLCHSQQSTRMNLSYDQCEYFATNGFFDPTISDDDLFSTAGASQIYTPVPDVFLDQPKEVSSQTTTNKAPWTNWNAKPGFGSRRN